MTSITMPRMGETLSEGTVAKWLKQEGDRVEKDEPIVEISTDKVDTEVPSPASGVLQKISVSEGETVDVDTELGVIEEVEAGGEKPRKAPEPGFEERAEAQPARVETPEKTEAPTPPAAKPEEKAPSEAKPPELHVGPGEAPSPEAKRPGFAAAHQRPGFISPVVRKLAGKKNIDLDTIQGTGAGGRITKKDVLAAAQKMPEAPQPAPARLAAVPPPPPAPEVTERPTPGRREEVVELSMVRKAIAENMLKSSQQTAPVTAIVEVDMENVAQQRGRFKNAFKEREGFSLTYLPFVARALVATLAEFPRFNAELSGNELIIKHYVNLGFSVDRPDGLVAPVVNNADALNISGLARAIHDLAERARSGHLRSEETRGGTFTLTNPGSLGTIIQTPIINPPQVAVLSLERIEKRVVPVEGGIGVKNMVYMPMTYDHRVVDGADAARFLSSLKERIETWDFSSELSEYAGGGLRRTA